MKKKEKRLYQKEHEGYAEVKQGKVVRRWYDKGDNYRQNHPKQIYIINE